MNRGHQESVIYDLSQGKLTMDKDGIMLLIDAMQSRLTNLQQAKDREIAELERIIRNGGDSEFFVQGTDYKIRCDDPFGECDNDVCGENRYYLPETARELGWTGTCPDGRNNQNLCPECKAKIDEIQPKVFSVTGTPIRGRNLPSSDTQPGWVSTFRNDNE